MLASIISLQVPKLAEFNLYQAFVTVLGLFILALLSHATYNRYFHPLRQFPGPFWGSVTDIYNTYLFGTRQVHLEQLKLHAKYGSVVRVSPNLLCFSDPALIPEVYHRHSEKTPFYNPGIAGEERPLLQIQGDREHAAKLRVLSPTYSKGHIRLLESTLDERIITTNRILQLRFACTGEPFDLAAYTRWYIYDTITQLIYGTPAGMVESGSDVDHLIGEWHRAFTLGGLVATLPWLMDPIITNRYLKPFLMPSKRHDIGSGHIMRAHHEMFENRLKNPQLARPGNMFDSLLQTKNPNNTPMSLEEAETQCFVLTVGSQDTSAAFISALMNNLLQYPKVSSNVQAEISAFEREGRLSSPVVTYQETTEMQYFMACVHETLRFSPSVSMILPRYAPAGGMNVNGVWISERTEIAANPYIIHRNIEVFGSDADIFRPERWLGNHEQVRLMHKSSLAFGYGSRKCLGQNIALFESQKFCVQLLRDFEVRCAAPGKPVKVENFGINVYYDQYVKLKTRVKLEEH